MEIPKGFFLERSLGLWPGFFAPSYASAELTMSLTKTQANDLTEVRRLIGQGWEEVATEYAKDRLGIFDRFAGRLVDLLCPIPGSTLLDVGTGTGAVALQSVAQVGSQGWVVGTDIAANMVYIARQSAREQAASTVTFGQMDAEWLAFPDDSFDVATCAFSLFQFLRMDRALAEMRRVLRPGGRLGLSNWGPGYFSPVAALQRDLFREFGLKPLLLNPIALKPDKLETLLREAGFTNIALVEKDEEVWFKSPEEVWAFDLDMGPFPIMLRQQLSIEEQKELARRLTVVLEDLVTERGIKCTFHLLFALAEKGGGIEPFH
jgi:ubiquinone/menaquinone biosynthesis C-methylase UbiE